MSRAPLFAWLCLFVWGAWLFAFQGLLASSPSLAAWTPEGGVLLLFALTCRAAPPRARWAALWLALLRTAFSADPPLAILAGYLGFVGACHLVRGALELDRPLVRAVIACLGAALLARLWTAAQARELAALGVGAAGLAGFAWTNALATGLAALLLGAGLARLPGLRPLWRRAGP